MDKNSGGHSVLSSNRSAGWASAPDAGDGDAVFGVGPGSSQPTLRPFSSGTAQPLFNQMVLSE